MFSIPDSKTKTNYTSYIGKDMSILVILSLLYHDGVHSGYSLVKKIKTMSEGLFKFRAGTVYSQIEKLLEDGFVVQSIEQITEKKVRAEYSLTITGIKKREKMLEEWNNAKELFDKLINGANGELIR